MVYTYQFSGISGRNQTCHISQRSYVDTGCAYSISVEQCAVSRSICNTAIRFNSIRVRSDRDACDSRDILSCHLRRRKRVGGTQYCSNIPAEQKRSAGTLRHHNNLSCSDFLERDFLISAYSDLLLAHPNSRVLGKKISSVLRGRVLSKTEIFEVALNRSASV